MLSKVGQRNISLALLQSLNLLLSHIWKLPSNARAHLTGGEIIKKKNKKIPKLWMMEMPLIYLKDVHIDFHTVTSSWYIWVFTYTSTWEKKH